MAELLRLRQTKLANARLGNDLAEQIVHAATRAHRAQEVILELIPISREAEERHLRACTALTRIIVTHKRLRQLNRTVLTIVRVHDNIAILHARVIANHIARNVFIRHRRAIRRLTRVIFRLDRILNRGRLLALAAHNAIIRLARQRPIFDAVHAIITTHRRANLRVAHRGEFLFQTRDVFKRGARRRVAAIKERMHHNAAFREFLPRATHQLEEVLLVRMHALILQQAKEMELRIILLPVRNQIRPLRRLEKFARGKTIVNALQLLHHDSPRAHVEVPHFRAPLIPIRQAHRFATAIQQAMRITRANLINDRRLRAVHTVAVLAGIDAPAIADD